MLAAYRQKLWDTWKSTHIVLQESTPHKSELLHRIQSDSFDNGQTHTWLTSMIAAKKATWRSVRDIETGHTIHVVSDRTPKELTHDLALGLRILRWMSQGTPIVWYWWDHSWSRILPAHTEPGRDHVNGGWAIPGVPEVHVYRREEAHKVLIHETIHALRLDVPHTSITPALHHFEHTLGRRLWPHLGEAFTELFAEWLWTIASSHTFSECIQRWDHQRLCSEKQAGQVWARIRTQTSDEDTNVFAYYILKWVLMQHEHEAILGPDHSVSKWFPWWVECLPRLQTMADNAKKTKGESLRMGMTCDV
jgi:hypothetical protein